jgi:hypothetical protein
MTMPKEIRLTHDLLDKELIDRDGETIGRVDGIVLELRPHGRPVVAYVECGATILARRLGARLARWVAAFERRVTGRDPATTRIAVERITAVEIDLCVSIDADETPALEFEHWLAKHIVSRIPGA